MKINNFEIPQNLVEAIAKEVLGKLCGDTTSPALKQKLPAIGERTHGGIYAGLSRGESGESDAHIILLDAAPEDDLDWADAVKWAQSLGDGARLPTRFESALLYANLQDQFINKWHWTGTQYGAYTAWNQNFHDGNQDSYGKSYEGRALAVRRLVSLKESIK